MTLFQRFLRLIPRPFKSLQRALDIEEEWTVFKQNIRPHNFKIFVFFGVVTYPFYQKPLFDNINTLKKYLLKEVEENLQPNKTLPRIVDSQYFSSQCSVKQLIDSILKDRNVKDEASGFVNQLSKKDAVQQGVLDLLLSVIKNPLFIDEAQQLGKKIVTENARDKAIEDELKKLVMKIIQSYQIQQQVKTLIEVVFASETATKTIINLLLNGVSDQRVKDALGDSFKYAFREILNDEQTVQQLKIFTYFLLREFQKDSEIKALMSTVIEKGIGINRNKKKDKQLEKILKLTKSNQTYEQKKTL